jgi:hypothetical protein
VEGARLAEEGAHVDEQEVDAGRLVPVRDNEPPDAVCRPLPPREELVRPVLGHEEGAHLARRAHRARRGGGELQARRPLALAPGRMPLLCSGLTGSAVGQLKRFPALIASSTPPTAPRAEGPRAAAPWACRSADKTRRLLVLQEATQLSSTQLRVEEVLASPGLAQHRSQHVKGSAESITIVVPFSLQRCRFSPRPRAHLFSGPGSPHARPLPASQLFLGT